MEPEEKTFSVLVNRNSPVDGVPSKLEDQTLEQIETFAGKHDLIPMFLQDNGYSHSSSDPMTFAQLRASISKGWYSSRTVHLFTRAWAKPSSEYSGS